MAQRILLEVTGLRIPSSKNFWKIQIVAARRNLSKKKKTMRTMPIKTTRANRNVKRTRTGVARRKSDEPRSDVGVPIVPQIAAVTTTLTTLAIPPDEGGIEDAVNAREKNHRLYDIPREGERIRGGDANENAIMNPVVVIKKAIVRRSGADGERNDGGERSHRLPANTSHRPKRTTMPIERELTEPRRATKVNEFSILTMI